MSNEHNQHPQLDHNDFEKEDLSPVGVFYFMAGLAVVGIVLYFVVMGMYRFLDNYERKHAAVASPMMTPKADTRAVTKEDIQAFPQPRLEEQERTQLTDFIQVQDQKLLTYDWIDKQSGSVRIPITRAMDLIAERGLPVRSETSTVMAGQPAKTQPAAAPAPAKAAAAPGN
jgi:hypothetical protein